jgi:AcrR family transcriptional regulator
MQERTEARHRASPGRPPRELAGEVENRILEAARGVFLESGLAAASIDEIARRAHAGKTTIYARFPTKEALFAAAIMHNASRVQAHFASDRPSGITIEDRLASVGTSILDHLLAGDTIDFMRLSAAEVQRFPDLARFGRMARERAEQTATRVLSEIANSDEIAAYPGLAPERLAATTHFFLDLVVSRILLRALLGEPIEPLRAEIETHVSNSIAFFLAACRVA